MLNLNPPLHRSPSKAEIKTFSEKTSQEIKVLVKMYDAAHKSVFYGLHPRHCAKIKIFGRI